MVLVRISTKENEEVGNELLRMLAVLFSNKLSAKFKKKKLQDEFGMRMTEKMEGGIDDMCNLSQGIREEGREEGRTEGMLIAMVAALEEVLENFGKLPEMLRDNIQKEDSLEVVKRWFSIAIRSESLEQFMKNANL